jgi:phosphopantothenoylcysteine decarboxylase/phosphopantothenate--cysteine ligase
VRFIGNHSSGKMGFEIAKAAANLGANVILVTGPTHQSITNSFVDVKPVVSAEEMYNEVHKHFKSSDIAILSAAVADYRPKTIARQKIKKKEATLSIELEKTKDILKSLGKIKTTQFLVGFALETENELEHAKGKLKTKHLDLIVLNSLRDKGAGFGVSTNKVTFITASEDVIENELKSKAEVAKDLMQHILKQLDA